jgi:biotin carboxyl carrier protein
VAAAAPAAPAAAAPRPAAGGKGGVKSPLPGVILDVKVKVGDAVKRGQTVIILEAMKMENQINADKDGIVKDIPVSKGESVLEGTDLIIIE